jgi:membrane carboxypeptidase/penicillin-binding protein PbpC
MVGSADYYNASIHGAINMAITPRQPGSALKPFVYALAMNPNLPQPLMPGSLIWDKQTTFITQDGKTYTPANYDGKEHGFVTVREALGSSLNIPAVIVLNKIGLKNFSAFAQNIGLNSLNNPKTYDLTIALGGGGVSLLELTNAYSVLASQGQKSKIQAILSIQDKSGKSLYQNESEKTQILDPQISWLISDILHDDTARTIGFGRNSILNIDRPAAVKTGTTTNFHDNWTVGYTPQLVVGVWVGNAGYQPMFEVTGLSGAAPIWHEFIRQALINQPEIWFPRPNNITSVELCKPINLSSPDCVIKYQDWMITGSEPIKSLNLPEGTENTSLPNAFEVLSPLPNAVYVASETQPTTLPISIRSFQTLDFFKVFINQKQIATLNHEPYQTWWEFPVGEATVAIEGWRNNLLVSAQSFTITVNPPLR